MRNILIVEINEDDLKKLGRWPIQRLHYSSFIERIKEADIIILDIILSEPTKDDYQLKMSIERHGRVILPAYFDKQMNLIFPAQTLGSFTHIGHIHLEQDTDGIVREVYHTLVSKNIAISSISSKAYELISGNFSPRTSLPFLEQLEEGIFQKDRMYINYCGPPGTFERISFFDVLNGVYPQSFFKGKRVLLGVTAIGLGNQFLTPFSHSRNPMSGVELQANILNTLVKNNPIRFVSQWILWPLIFFLSFLIYLLFKKLSEKKVIQLGLIFLLVLTAIFYFLFTAFNLWLRPTIFYFTFTAVFFITYSIKLREAAKSLDHAYSEILQQIRLKKELMEIRENGKGVKGILTPGGIQAKADLLSDISHQLIFEKTLADYALLNHLHAVLLFGPDGKNIIANELAVIYCETNSIEWKTLEKFIEGLSSYLLDQHFLEAMEHNHPHATSMICFPFPQQKYFKIDSSTIDFQKGKYLLFTLSDVTQIKELEILKGHLLTLKRTEEALRESNARYDELVRRIPVGVFILRIHSDGSMVFEYGSPRLHQILGIEEGILLHHADLIFDLAHPDDREGLISIVREAAKDLKPFSWEGRFIIRGETRWLGIESESKEVPGGGSHLTGIITDITDRKSEEEMLEKAFKEIKRLKEQLEAENIYLREEVKIKEGPRDIIGVSNPIKYVMHRIQQIAKTNTTVLLIGETGTGKGLFAHYLHEMSDRRDKPLVVVNCANLPPNLIESELFGREKGAFTGATSKQIGRFELANGSTIFLDEIGELPIDLQAKLLRVIEDGEFERLGNPHPIKVDVRIIASTNRNLEEEIKRGKFRIDLFYRLNVFPITIPPLRERKEDILLLTKFFVERFSKIHGKLITKIPTNIIKILENYNWPGNVRELMHVIERAVIISNGPELRLAEPIDSVPEVKTNEELGIASAKINKNLSEIEKEYILKVLQETGWKIEGENGAAKILGMNPSTLRGRMRKLGINRPKKY